MTCIKCQKIKPHMISMCAECYKANMADQLRFKKACDIGGALAEKLNTIRKQVEALSDEAAARADKFNRMVADGNKDALPLKLEHEARKYAYDRVLDLIDAEQNPPEEG